MSNVANIIARILEESKQESEAIWQEYQAKTDEIKRQAELSAKASVLEIQKNAEADAAEHKRRGLAVAELEARKRALATRQALIDTAFEETLKALAVLDEGKYAEWIVKTVLEAAETGEETLLVAEKDRPLFTKMLDKLNKSLAESGRKGALKLSHESGAFVGGMVLIGEYTEKNCTFETLLRLEREDIEAEVASILFA